MEINKLKDCAYEIAVKHGWYEDNPSLIHHFMMIVTELCEAIAADRNNINAERSEFEAALRTMSFQSAFEKYIKDTVEDEFADAVIRILSIAGHDKAVLPEHSFSKENLEKGVCVANDTCVSGELNREMTLPEEMFMIAYNLLNADVNQVRIGDVLFALIVIAKRRGIDIEWHIEQKIKYNNLRPYKHGGKKY